MSKPTYIVENPGYGSTLILEDKDGKKSLKYIFPDAPKPKYYTPSNTKFPSVNSVIATQNARKMVKEIKEESKRDKRLEERLRIVREKAEKEEEKEKRKKEEKRKQEEEKRKQEAIMDDIEFSSEDDIATILEKNKSLKNKKSPKRKQEASFLNMDDIEFSGEDDVATILEKNKSIKNKKSPKKGGKRNKTKKRRARSRRR